MAELNKKLFGNVTGKFGDAVFKQRKGKNIIAQRAKKYHMPDTDDYRTRTGKFRLSARIGSAIISIPVLKLIWSLFLPEKDKVFQNLLSINYPYLGLNSVTGMLKIVPDNGIGVKLNTLAVADGAVNVSLNPLTPLSGIDITAEKKIELFVILFLSNPAHEDSEPYSVIGLTSSKISFDLTNSISFSINLSTADQELVSRFNSKSFFLTVVTFDEEDNYSHYSKTFNHTI